MSKIVVGLSGGVDSAVCASMLKRQGHEVIAMTMIPFEGAAFYGDAKKVADFLDIDHRVVDMSSAFYEKVMKNFASEYAKGRTPNPCNRCNPYIKWEAMLNLADEIGAEYVATGHYAKIERINGRFAIRNAETSTKDQTYALCNLTQEQLSRTRMILGNYEKSEIREYAKDVGIPVALKPDSQDICFIQNGNYSEFLQKMRGKEEEKGNFVNAKGEILGVHEGISHYTIGQRKGLNIAAGHPVYVTGISAERNEVVIGEYPDLFSMEMEVENVNFMAGTEADLPRRLLCKVRYAHKGTNCVMEVKDGKYLVKFVEPVRAITPGQTAVFYDGDYVFAGSVIK